MAKQTYTVDPNVEYTVTFTNQYGNNGNSQTETRKVSPGGYVTNLPSLAAEYGDYKSEGWVIDGSGLAFTTSTQVNGSMSVTAKWTPKNGIQYIVSFHANIPPDYVDGAGYAIKFVPKDGSIGNTNMPSPPTNPSGYTFGGWYANPSGTGTPFAGNTQVTNSRTVYAKWTPTGATRTVKFFLNYSGASTTDAFHTAIFPTSMENVPEGLWPSTPEARKVGNETYVCVGWFTNTEGTGTAFTLATKVTGDMSVHAKWAIFDPTGWKTVFIDKDEMKAIPGYVKLEVLHFKAGGNKPATDSAYGGGAGGNGSVRIRKIFTSNTMSEAGQVDYLFDVLGSPPILPNGEPNFWWINGNFQTAATQGSFFVDQNTAPPPDNAASGMGYGGGFGSPRLAQGRYIGFIIKEADTTGNARAEAHDEEAGAGIGFVKNFYFTEMKGESGGGTTGGTVDAPVASPGTMSFNEDLLISLSSGTSGAEIYFTTDGTNPTKSSMLYSGPFMVMSDMTIKAFASNTGAGMTDSAVETFTYTKIGARQPSGNVVTYDYGNNGFVPASMKYSGSASGSVGNVTVKAGGQNIDLYGVKVNNTRQWDGGKTSVYGKRDTIPVAMFDVYNKDSSVSMEVTLPSTTNVIIRPGNIAKTISGSTVSFTIPKAGQYSVEWNNSNDQPVNALLIFASPYEAFSGYITTVPPGIHTQNFGVGNGSTLYLMPGAVIRGTVTLGRNSKIVGRGIIDGSTFTGWDGNNPGGSTATGYIKSYQASNIEIRGVSVFDPDGWGMQIQDSNIVTIDNFKIISSRQNSDGISIQSSSNMTITNSFVRSWDDNIVVKNYAGPYAANPNTADNPLRYPYPYSRHTTAEHCVLWTDLAQSLEIGFETNKGKVASPNQDPKIHDVTFNNITILHAMHKAPISVHNGDNAVITNVTFSNITVENFQGGMGSPNDGFNYIIDLTNSTSAAPGAGWVTITERGSINITIRDVKMTGRTGQGSRIESSGVTRNITGVTYNGAAWNP
jgi:uncharacterized repeat protein (TIGR02543 family)